MSIVITIHKVNLLEKAGDMMSVTYICSSFTGKHKIFGNINRIMSIGLENLAGSYLLFQ